MPGAVHPFSLCYLFLHFFKGDLELVNLADLLIQLSSYLFHPWHLWGSFFSLSQMPPQNSANFSISGISPSCASSPSSLLNNPFWSRWNMISSCFLLRFFSHFASFTFFVTHLVQALLSGIPQIVISCIFIDQDSQFLDDLLFFLSWFSPLSPSIQLSKTILEITVQIEPQPAALDFHNLPQYSSCSK